MHGYLGTVEFPARLSDHLRYGGAVGLLDRMPEQDRRQLKKLSLYVGGIVVAMLAFFAWLDWQTAAEKTALEPWAVLARSVTSLPSEALDPDGGYIKGRVLAVAMETLQPDRVQLQLPQEFRSANPEDVGTLALLTYRTKEFGKYDDGTPARVRVCDIALVDRSKNAIIGRHTVEGPRPPKTITKGSQWEGDGAMPYPQIISYLKSLPRRR
jgi:hypothetical protein